MTFSYRVKEEILNFKYINDHCNLAVLLAYINNSCSRLEICNKIYLYFYFDKFLVSKKIYYLLKNNYNIEPEILIRKNIKMKKKYYFIIIKSQENVNFLNSIRNIDILKRNCCKRAYLKENFLTNGSLSDPSKSYHIEFVYNNNLNAKTIYDILNYYNLNAKIIKRKKNFVVYIKEGENIVYILNLIGAHNSLMALENVRILKDISNNINRKVNCETSNLSKTINASIKQCDDIKFVINKKGKNYLPEQLQEVASIRLKYPEYSLKEIGNILKYPISKSGVNHRLRKISYIAENLRKETN